MLRGKPLAIDLFCGLGGWTEGLLAEGYRVVGFDIERHRYPARDFSLPKEVGKGMTGKNHNGTTLIGAAREQVHGYHTAPFTGGWHEYPAQLVLQDVLTIHGAQFKDADLIVASPPCQEFSYMAMPWTRAKRIAAEYRDGTRDVQQLTALFDACFRIQREAIEASGRFIPLVVENVRGAQPWVGRARTHFGSFYLWGDVPALMPIARGAVKVEGFRFDGSGKSFQSVAVEQSGVKMAAMGAGCIRTEKGRSAALSNYDQLRDQLQRGVKGFTPNGEPLGKNTLGRKHGSRSKARKAASAHIAKIPLVLARHIARAWHPDAC